ncbi:MAG: hypothetical protein CM1200mP20_16460 [Pseudomonadota bacterium]|nr:MAG: hypothetical protein CM1200mP20_16460 [Pseudomonadota bacterium]
MTEGAMWQIEGAREAPLAPGSASFKPVKNLLRQCASVGFAAPPMAFTKTIERRSPSP